MCSSDLVSFYHAIEFFNLSNNPWLSVILSLVAEIGQATVLFSLLMSSNNRSKIMPWVVMFILTALQVVGNVFSCYTFIEEADSERFIYFQKSILFFLDESPQNMKVIVEWITGSLLPIIALCLTSLVAESLHHKDEDYTIEGAENIDESISIDDTIPTSNEAVSGNTDDEIIAEDILNHNIADKINKRKAKRVKKGDSIITDTNVPNTNLDSNSIETIEVKQGIQ